MKCKLCKSDSIVFVEQFKPYLDKEWLFDVYDCDSCHSRFALRDTSINYHEEIHSSSDSPYSFHYNRAQEIKEMLNDIRSCEKYLMNISPIFYNLIEYLNKQSKEISILEIGCSTGYITAFLQENGFKDTLGIDISASAIAYAEKEFGEFYALEEKKNKKYDVIFHSGLIGCVDEPIEFLEYYLNKLSENGVMLFNAPNVDSIRETNELWVSTPPPDLIYLFKDNVFTNIFSPIFKTSVSKTMTPLTILRKYINRLKKCDNNTYPTYFISNKIGNKSTNNKIKKYIKRMISGTISFLVRLKLLNHYSDDYGLLYEIKRAKDG